MDAVEAASVGAVEAAGAGAELPIEASAALLFLKRRRRSLVAMERAVRRPAPLPALQTEVPGPRRAGLKRGVEVGECAARPSRNIARRHHSKSLPAPGGGALRRRRPPAIEGGVAARGRSSRASSRSRGLGRPPRRARQATLATAAAGVSRERPPAAGRDGSPRAAHARNRRRR